MEEEHGKKYYAVLILRIVTSLTLALLGTFLFNEDNYPLWVNLLFMVSSYLIISYDILIEVAEHIFKEHDFFNEDTLMILASFGAFALRAFGKEHNEFLEAVLVILLFQIGEVFEDYAADKSKDAILDSIDCKEEKAFVVSEGKLIEKEAEELQINDIVSLSSGQKIICDGTLIEGICEVDESSLTGESRPIAKKTGDLVYSGTICLSGSAKVCVSKEYSDSTVAKLAKAIEDAAEKKSHRERFITRFARVYTPLVVGIAMLVAILPPLFLGIGDSGVWSKWIYSALSFLVVSCPCAIVISVPLAYFSGLGVAAKHGLLVKGASFFDALNNLRLVAFDKTGTITEGKLSLSEIHAENGDKEAFLSLAKRLESRSKHPLANAFFVDDERKEHSFAKYEEIPGLGIRAESDGNSYLLGRSELLKKEGVSFLEQKGDSTYIYLAENDKYLGFARLNDNLKEHSERFVNSLRKKGIETLLLSGDNEESVKTVATALSVDKYKSSCLPQEKLDCLTLEKEKKGAIAYLGDGINDAPALTLSDVGVAMGGLGSDLAVANADCVILNDDPYRFIALLKIAKATENRAIFNIALSLSVKGLIVGLSVAASIMGTWELPLWVAVLGDSGLAVLAILSSLLLQTKKIKE